jgi:hypothetical protein
LIDLVDGRSARLSPVLKFWCALLGRPPGVPRSKIESGNDYPAIHQGYERNGLLLGFHHLDFLLVGEIKVHKVPLTLMKVSVWSTLEHP